MTVKCTTAGTTKSTPNGGNVMTDRSDAFLEFHDDDRTRLSGVLAPAIALVCIVVGLILIAGASAWA